MKVILASQNQHKLVELSAILSQLGFEIALESEYGLHVDVDETGTTFEENSLLKAEAVMKASGLPVLADDSGLMVDALDGAPGVYSARYGHKNSDAERIEYLLSNLKDVPAEQRTAKFVCVITCLWPDGRKIAARGRDRGALDMTPCFICRNFKRPMPNSARRKRTPSPTVRGHFRHFAESIGRNLNMMTSKERAEFRAQANTLDVTLIVGKGGISDTLLDEAVVLLDSHELVKGRVLETSGLTAREASDAICEALGAEGIACVGTKFVIWRKSEKVEQEKKKAASKKPAKKVSGNYNPVKAGLRARKQAAEQQRKQRKQYFHDKAVSAAIERSRQQKEEQ